MLQLPLALRPRSTATFRDFVAGCNAAATSHVQAAAAGRGEQFVYLWGSAGAGKSHLLESACHACGSQGKLSALVSLREWSTLGASVLDDLEQLTLVCIDDLDAIAGFSAWEERLFHLHNRARETGTRLLISGARSPAALGLGLSDLASRLSAALVYRLLELDDDQRISVLRRRAARRGFEMPEDVAEYLLRRQPRDMHSLMALVERLDAASLAAQRRVTIPFVRELLARIPHQDFG